MSVELGKWFPEGESTRRGLPVQRLRLWYLKDQVRVLRLTRSVFFLSAVAYGMRHSSLLLCLLLGVVFDLAKQHFLRVGPGQPLDARTRGLIEDPAPTLFW